MSDPHPVLDAYRRIAAYGADHCFAVASGRDLPSRQTRFRRWDRAHLWYTGVAE
jgi:hypothetical protein